MVEVKQTCLLSSSEDSSCSGVVVDPKNGFIIAHGVLILSALNKHDKLWQKLNNKSIVPGTELLNPKIEVQFERALKKNPTNLAANFVTSLLNFQSPSSPSILKAKASVVYMWKAKTFEQTLNSLFPKSDRWSFSEQSTENTSSKSDIDASKLASLLPYFVLLKVDLSIKCLPLKYISSNTLHIGDCIYAVGTPFGSLSPPVFLNSVSKGILCNQSGKDNCLLLTDARCIPGCEGGALYTGREDNRLLVGLVVAPLCWKANEWVGYTIACSIQEILHSLDIASKSARNIIRTIPVEGVNSLVQSNHNSGFLSHSQHIVLIQSPTVWGTGLLVNSQHGLVLTCGHVVKSNKQVNVQVSLPSGRRRMFPASVLYAVPDQQAFDIAVLQLLDWEQPQGFLQDIQVATDVSEGQSVCMIGHGVFGREHKLDATVTKGVVAKTVTMHEQMVMIQATCAVHAGASGGPLVAEDGSFIGIVTCNAKDTTNGAMYPHINLSVPLVTIIPVLQDYILSKDPNILTQLHVEESTVQSLWHLALKELPDDTGSPASKL